MFYGSFGTQNSLVTVIFKFYQRKGQIPVKLDQIWSNFKIQNFLTQVCLSCAVLSQDSKKCHLVFVQQLEMPKIALQKCDAITFAWFRGHCTSKNKDVAAKFCMRVVFMYLGHIYSFFG